MKKLIYLIVLTLILGLVLTGCLLSNVGQVPATGQKGMPFPSAANLVALWHFDEGSGAIAYDSTVNSNDGTVYGASWIDGKLGKALNFDGIDDYVDCGDISTVNWENLTTEAWVYWDGNTVNGYAGVYCKAYGNDIGRLLINPAGRILVQNGNGDFYSDNTGDVPDNEWCHIAYVYDQGVGKEYIYVNGAQKGEQVRTGDITQNSTTFWIGYGWMGPTYYIFSGIIDEVRIWDGALTEAEILYSYEDETLHVDDDWAQWPGAYYTINEALAVAGDGDTIIVHEGTYYENITINKTLTIEGVSGSIINGDTNVDGTPDGNCITINADGVTIDGFEITNGYNGINGQTSNSVIKNNTIHDNLNYAGSNGVGILLWGDNDDNLIENNTIYNNDRQGIFIGFGDNTKISTGNTISGNKIHDNGLYTLPNGPDASAYGIQLWNADENTISGNKIHHHDDWFYYPDFDFAQGIYLHNSIGNSVTNNDLHHNNYGVGVWSPARGAGSNSINYNNIFQNTGFGVRSFDALSLDAENNWWGHRSGPTHSGNPGGRGDKVSDNVNYTPWQQKPVTPRN